MILLNSCQKYSLGEIHNFSMHTDYFGDCEIEYEGNKYIVTEEEVSSLKENILQKLSIVMNSNTVV